MSTYEKDHSQKKAPGAFRNLAKYGFYGALTGVGVVGLVSANHSLNQPVPPEVSMNMLEDAEDRHEAVSAKLSDVYNRAGMNCVAAVENSFEHVPPLKYQSYMYQDFSRGDLSVYEVRAIERDFTTVTSAAEAEVAASGWCDTEGNDGTYTITQVHEALFEEAITKDAIADAKSSLDNYERWEEARDANFSIQFAGGMIAVCAVAGVLYGRISDPNAY